jgi:HPt (histidine-containing phosphotransfer) domain-containing protein
MSEMKESAQIDALTQWRDAAHKLRGAAANMGMAGLEKLCLDSERTTAPSPRLLQEIDDEIARIKTFIAEKAPSLFITENPKEVNSCPR